MSADTLTADTTHRDKRQLQVQILLLVLLTVLAYQDVRHHHFVWDTIPFVLENPWIHEWSVDNVVSMLTQAHAANWQPLVMLSHALDITLFGYDSGMHHLVNLALHVGNTLLLFFLVRVLLSHQPTIRDWTAFLTALIFALHPQHVESVAWVVERKDVLYSVFALSVLLLHAGRNPEARAFDRRGIATFVLFLLAVSAKPMAVTLPVALMMLDLYPLQRYQLKPGDMCKSALEKWPYFVVALLVSLLTLQTQSIAMPAAENLPLWARALNAVDNTWFYTWYYIWPVNLSPFYPYPEDASLLVSPAFWLPGTLYLTVTITLSAWWYYRGIRWPLLLFGFYLLTLLPVSGLIQVGPAKATDHYVYLATIPFSLLTALAVVYSWQQFAAARLAILATTGVYLVFLLALTVVQVSVWSSPLTLWTRVAQLYPENPFGHRNLAAVYAQMHHWDKALFHAEKSVALGSPDPAIVAEILEARQRLEDPPTSSGAGG